MLSTTQSQTHTHPVHQTSSLTFEDQMARIRNIVESMKQQTTKIQPSRRAKSAPSRPPRVAQSETAPTKRTKRARSETCTYEEPVRVSKRLKGIAAEKMEDIVVAVNFGEEPMEGDDVKGAIDGEKRKKFGRTLSSVTSTTVAEEEGDEMSTQSTLPDDEIESPLFPQSPTLTTSVDNNPSKPPPSQKIANSKSAEGMSAQTEETRAEETRPLYTNTVPPPVQIEGHPSLRVLYNSTLLHRKSAPLPNHEWQSNYFLAHIPPPLRETHIAHFQKHGHFVIPNTIFSPAPTTDEPILQIISEFLDRFALPKQPFPTFTTFIDSQTHTLNPHAIQWWFQLASYFDIPSYLDHVYTTTPGQWHIVWHSLPTLSVLREFGSVTETLGMKRGREMVHQELARRIGRARGLKKGRKGVSARLGLFRMGYEELRELSKKYDAVDKGVGDCDFCCVKPDFK